MKCYLKKILACLLVYLFMLPVALTDEANADGGSFSIPDDAVLLGGHYYKVYDISLSWDEARAYCEALGGHLMTITSAEEQAYVMTLPLQPYKNYWLGASDAKTEGTWKWITGEKWSYTAWGTDQPDNSQMYTGVDEDYLQLCESWGRLWNDSANIQDSTADIGFICEWDGDGTESEIPSTVTAGNLTYSIKNNTATVTGAVKSNSAVKIPGTITVSGKKIKVTAIAAGAFKGDKKIKTVTIGANVTSIGKEAFYGCVALSKISIPSKVDSIGKKAFMNCANLKAITIKTTKLTTKNVASNAFKGIAAKPTFKVPSSKLKEYQKLMLKRGAPKIAVFK